LELLTSGEAAARAGVCTKTIRKWADDGLLAARETPGGRLRIKAEDLDAVMRPVAAPLRDEGRGGED
jgi:excisionase family DNA binding protein